MKHILLFICIITAICSSYADKHIPSEETNYPSEYVTAINSAGGIINDLSDSSEIILEEPIYGYVNFSGFESMPETKTSDLQGWIEFFDGAGNYF